MNANDPAFLLKALPNDDFRTPFASPVVVTPTGSGYACIHCAGRGYQVSVHPVPWVDNTNQGTFQYRTKLCCLHCGGLGFNIDTQTPTEPDPTPPLVAEPYIDVDFTHEE